MFTRKRYGFWSFILGRSSRNFFVHFGRSFIRARVFRAKVSGSSKRIWVFWFLCVFNESPTGKASFGGRSIFDKIVEGVRVGEVLEEGADLGVKSTVELVGKVTLIEGGVLGNVLEVDSVGADGAFPLSNGG